MTVYEKQYRQKVIDFMPMAKKQCQVVNKRIAAIREEHGFLTWMEIYQLMLLQNLLDRVVRKAARIEQLVSNNLQAEEKESTTINN